MTYSDIKRVLVKMNIHPGTIEKWIGSENMHFCQSQDNKSRYHVYLILDNNNKYCLVYSNFKTDYPIFELPYKPPNINNVLPSLW